MNDFEKSQVIISRIISFLATHGVRRVTFNAGKLFSETTEEIENDLIFEALIWLKNHGIVHFEHVEYDTVEVIMAVLTPLGFAALDKEILINNEQKTMGKAIKEINSSALSVNGLGDLIGGVLGGFTKSIGS